LKKAVIVGSGAGGAMCARELQGQYDVTVLEAGREFHPFGANLRLIQKIKRTGLLFDAREIPLLFPEMRIRRAGSRMILVNGRGTGGTTTISAGNGLRMDGDLKKLGLNLDAEFEELARDVPLSTAHQKRWRPATRRLFEAFQSVGLDPQPIPKMGRYELCRGCGRCILGCPCGVKWDSRRLLDQALQKGARIITRCRVQEIATSGGHATGVTARKGLGKKFFPADLVILAAGGLGTPVILQNSGVPCRPRLFVDPVLTVATDWEAAGQDKEITMPFVSQREGYILSPYFDYLSFFFKTDWRSKLGNTLGIMIKLADDAEGSISKSRLQKSLTAHDQGRLAEALEICAAVFSRLGVDKGRLVLGIINAGHPGGMLPLTAHEAESMHSPLLPANVYVADATLFPESLGNPAILTILALAKRVSKVCLESAVRGQ
jgi:choline dehydrogenase-like flavoprotein